MPGLRLPLPSDASTRAWFARVVPFAVFVVFLSVTHWLGPHAGPGVDVRWLYPVRTGVVVLMLLSWWGDYRELRWPPGISAKDALLALGVGIGVFWVWIHLDFGWFSLGGGHGFDPTNAGGGIDWPLASMRWVGATLVVPVMEELFWRSFLMRWIDRVGFLGVNPTTTSAKALVVSALMFGFEHDLWLAGTIAGLAYGGLYRLRGNLWLPILAHAVTNGVLGAWVLTTGSWKFW